MDSLDVNKRLEKLSALDYKVEISVYVVMQLLRHTRALHELMLWFLLLNVCGFQET